MYSLYVSKYSRWTKEEDLLLKKIHNLYSDKRLAEVFSRKRIAIVHRRQRLGLKKDRPARNKFQSIATKGKINKGRGKDSNHWGGGKWTTPIGYVYIYCPAHPNAVYGKRYVLEHRLAMEQKVGRLLKKDEHVHHKNGKKGDNRIENLELLTISEHRSLHTKGKNNPLYNVRRYGKGNPNYKHGKYCIQSIK